jgi:subtilisin family serine protease
MQRLRIHRQVVCCLIAVALLSGCRGSRWGRGALPPPPPPTPPVQTAACPSSGDTPTAFTFNSQERARRAARSAPRGHFVPGEIAITLGGVANVAGLSAALNKIHATVIGEARAGGAAVRIISLEPSRVSEAIGALQSLRSVRSVSRVAYRYAMSITANDPYFTGFGAPGPYFETSTSPGQWDMHVINAADAWNAVAFAPPVPAATIAVIDSGVDVTHPELSGGKITRTKCFVTFPAGSQQTTSSFVTDTDGHGTNVAGIADGNTNNGLGFASVAFSAPLLAYRIFPTTPSGGCENSTNPQCSTNTVDEASAIDDAVNHGAKVINLSIGGSCEAGDPEAQAVANAISHGVVVVAAAGNESAGQLDCPAADAGVLAVGASALDDSGTVKEVVASYSNFLTTNGSGHYLVAPGGDPSGSSDNDDLHWIENIYSKTAVQAGDCQPDLNSTSSTIDCRILIAGTSQATPHVAGAAALVLAVRPAYTPSQVAAALCNSAFNINDSKQGCGRLDARAAVNYARSH